MRKLLSVVVILALGAGILWWRMQDGATAITLRNARLVPVADQPDQAMLTLTLENTGGPVAVTGASSSETARVMLAGLRGDAEYATIPARSAPVFAMDGAHLHLMGLSAAPAPGTTLPFSLTLSDGSTVSARATVAEAAMVHGSEGVEAPDMTLAMSVTPQGDGWVVTLETTGITFRPLGTDPVEHVAGEGHAHLYLDGLKLQRMYGPEATIGPLPPGEYELRIVLNSNDHRSYLSDGQSVEAIATLNAGEQRP